MNGGATPNSRQDTRGGVAQDTAPGAAMESQPDPTPEPDPDDDMPPPVFTPLCDDDPCWCK